jgi:hypothetical protein
MSEPPRRRRALLDVNVWVALFDDAHQFSQRANAFIEQADVQIATCPLVENGVIRVMSLPGPQPGHRPVPAGTCSQARGNAGQLRPGHRAFGGASGRCRAPVDAVAGAAAAAFRK